MVRSLHLFIFEPMKKYATLFIAFIYLFSATGLKELAKVNVVIEHFSEHHQKDTSITFLHFLIMHYITDDSNDKDDITDNQLPFKSPQTTVGTMVWLADNNYTSSISFHPLMMSKNTYAAFMDFFVVSNFHSLVWHPPQLV